MSFTVSSLLIPIQLCGGKKTKYSKYNNVFRVFLSFSLTFDAIPCYYDYKNPQVSSVSLLVHFIQIPYKKMKKSVAPLSLKEPVQGVRKCILPDFLKLFDRLRYCITEKNFLIFSRKNYYPFPKRCNTVKTRLWNIPLKTASFQRLYFNFDFKNRNVTYMLHFYFLHLQQKNRSLRSATVVVLFDCVLTLVVNNGC